MVGSMWVYGTKKYKHQLWEAQYATKSKHINLQHQAYNPTS
jgi:hypothetical protein